MKKKNGYVIMYTVDCITFSHTYFEFIETFDIATHRKCFLLSQPYVSKVYLFKRYI